MKILVTCIFLLMSISHAEESASENGYKLLSSAKKIYQVHPESKSCEDVTKYQQGISDSWKNGGFDVPGIGFMHYRFTVVDLGVNQAGNGKYLITDTMGKEMIRAFIVNNKIFCELVASNTKAVTDIRNMISKEYGITLKIK